MKMSHADYYFENCSDLVVVADFNGYFVKLSKRWEQLLGFTREEMMLRPYIDFVHAEDQGSSRTKISEFLNGGGAKRFTNRFVHKDGSYRFLRWTVVADVENGFINGSAIVVSEFSEGEERLLNCLDALKFGVWEWNIITGQTKWDTNVFRLYHQPETATINSSQFWKSIVHHEDYERFQFRIQEAAQTGGEFEVRYRIHTPSNEVRYISTRGYATRNEKHEVVSLIGISWDVTNEAALSERLNFVIEGANLGSWDWWLDSNKLSFNRRWAEMLGYNHDSLSQSLETWDNLVHPDDKDQAYKDLNDAISGKTPYYENIHRLRHANGSWVWILDRGKISEWTREGKALRFSGTHFDLTEQKNIEHSLKAEKKRFEDLVYGLNKSALVALIDRKGCFVSLNERAYKTFDFEADELIGRHHSILGTDHHKRSFVFDVVTSIRNQGLWQGEIRSQTKQGTPVWLESTAVEVAGEGNEAQFLIILFDVTAKRHAEEKLMNSAKMASLGEMAAGVAHEINNPLAIIQGKTSKVVDLMDQAQENRTKILKELEKIGATSERIARIVKGLKTFSRDADQDPVSRVTVHSLLTETLELCQERFKVNNVKLTISNLPDIEIDCRSTQISQVLLNLLNNAYDAVQVLAEKWIHIDFVISAHETFQIKVTDSGSGIPRDVASKLMRPFFTTKEVGKGTGLGLSISRGIAEDHQGALWLDQNCPNTRFVLEIPLNQQTQPRNRISA